MNHIWFVAKFEYARNVFKKSFLFILLGVPLMLAFSLGTGFFLESLKDNARPMGYIDQSGVLPGPEVNLASAGGPGDSSGFIAYADEATARAALQAGEIQAYFRLPSDYLRTRQVDAVYLQRPKEADWRQFFDFLQFSLLADQPPEIAHRLAEGSHVVVRSLDGLRQVSHEAPTFGLLMPLLTMMAFLLLLLISSGYMMSAVNEEKENRTIEVLATSISTGKLMAGKVLGIVATSLTMLLTWSVLFLGGILIAAQAGVGWFNDLALDWRSILAILAVAIPAYILAAALMIAIGAMVTTHQEAQSVSGVFLILHLLPLYAGLIFINSPHHPLGVLFSLLPFTALVTLGMRNLFTIVPFWQVAVSVAVQTLGAVGAIWLAGRALRLGMLRYGQRLNWQALWKGRA